MNIFYIVGNIIGTSYPVRINLVLTDELTKIGISFKSSAFRNSVEPIQGTAPLVKLRTITITLAHTPYTHNPHSGEQMNMNTL